DVIALAVRWYVRYRLSYAEVSEWLAGRGVLVDQSTVYRWVQRHMRCLARSLESTASLWVRTGEWTRPTLGSGADGTTSLEPSMGMVRSPMRTCRRRVTRLPRAGSSSGQSLPAEPSHGESSQTRPSPTRQRSVWLYPVYSIAPGVTAP